MIYTVISDIHSNAPALDAFFDFFPESSQLVCLGDVIGYGTSPSYCLDQIRRKMPAMINGNHERWCLNPEGLKYASPAARHSLEWTRMRITDSDKMYLSELPEMMMLEDRFMLAHGSPRDPDEYLFEAEEAMLSIVELKSQGVPLAFVGHTHIPGVFTQRGRWFYQEGRQILLDKSETYIINPEAWVSRGIRIRERHFACSTARR